MAGSQSRAPRVPLEQWRALRAVVDAGGYAAAAALLHKSQSAITYAVQKLESILGVPVFEVHGRKAVLTPAGQVLYRRAGALLDEASALETAAGELAQGGEAELRLAAETIFPTWLLLGALQQFGEEWPSTRIELFETVLGGTEEALLERRADLVIAGVVPQGFMGDPLMQLRIVAVTAPEHPLQHLDRPVTQHDLRRYRQLVIRDSGTQRKRSAGWLAAEARWTVSHKATSIRAVRMGLGFAWYPEDVVTEELAAGTLKRLRLETGTERYADLYLIFADRDYASRGVQRLAELLHQTADGHTAKGARTHRTRKRRERGCAPPPERD